MEKGLLDIKVINNERCETLANFRKANFNDDFIDLNRIDGGFSKRFRPLNNPGTSNTNPFAESKLCFLS